MNDDVANALAFDAWSRERENASFSDWLRGELDRTGAQLSAAEQERVHDLFRRSVDLEEAFFDATYD